MEINKKAEAVFTFSSEDYFLVHDMSYDNGFEWSLNPRIDMSYCSKPDQVASAEIYLDEENAIKLKKAGFLIIEM